MLHRKLSGVLPSLPLHCSFAARTLGALREAMRHFPSPTFIEVYPVRAACDPGSAIAAFRPKVF
jgi:hypothetical protein